MLHIRPHRIFDLVQDGIAERIVRVKIPYRTENWLLETFLLIAATRIVSARRIFEFGTFRGATTLNLALNCPGAEVFTFDLDPKLAGQLEQDQLSAKIASQHLAMNGHMEFDDLKLPAKITQLEGDSRTFDFSPYYRSMDFVFVDGGHDRNTLAADTANAFRMAQSGNGCIAWHDYGNPEYSDVKAYLDQVSQSASIFHVEDSRLCFWFTNPVVMNALVP